MTVPIAELQALPCDWRLVRVGPDKAPIAGSGWFDVDDYSPDDAATLNGSSPAAWGLKAGPASGGVLVLDLDSEGWEQSFQGVTGHSITDLPATIGWSSGKPGRSARAFTVHDRDWWPHLANRRHWCNKAGETCWELRWDRHQSVILGRHPETGSYRWLPGQSPAEVEPAAAPEWLLEALLIQEHPDAEPVVLTAEDAGRAVAMLQCLPAAEFSGYSDWLQVGMALHHTDPGLLTAWVDWSRQMANFDEAECLKKWESFGKGHKGRPVTIGTLHHFAKKHGYKPARKVTKGSGFVSASERRSSSQAKNRRSWAERNRRKLSHSRLMACFDRCVEVQAKKQRNSLTRRARLLKVLKDLGLNNYINRQEISQRVLEAKDRQQGHRFQALTAVDRLAMQRPSVDWVITGLIPANDLTVYGGRPKVGKTETGMQMAAAVLKGGEFLGYQITAQRPVLLVTDDQADGDTADTLQRLGIWDHPLLIWSRHFRLTEHDLDALLATIKANPGALVILDSLRSISRSLQFGENDPEIGAALYDLKASVTDAGGALLLIHHCNKAEGLTGTEALSGHSAIAGAANTILTMHYLPDANGKPIKDAPQRRLVREARSGDGFDLVISRTAGGSGLHVAGSFSDWQQQAEEARKHAKGVERLTPLAQEVLEVLQEADGWLRRRDVTEALGRPWEDRGRNKEARQVDEALRRLTAMALVESVRSGTEATFRISSRETHQDNPDNQDNQ